MRRLFLLLVVSLIFMSSSAMAFNGLRKGFVVGGGLGFAPVGKWSLDNTSLEDSNAGLALNLMIGYAWDEFNMIIYEGNVVSYTTDIFGDRTVAQGFNGVSWYHYFGPMGKSFFSVAGLGFYVMNVEDFDANDPGIGLLGGGGYEFSRHLQVGGYFSLGKTSDSPADFSHVHLSVLVSVVAF